MKPLHIAFGISTIALLVGGSIALRNKIDYDRDGKAIQKLIVEYKAMGVPTNGSELVKSISDDENAWLDIDPMIINRTTKGARILYRSDLPRAFVFGSTESDLQTISKHLAKNQELRDQIEKALDAKPKLQVPHNYDEGYYMLLPEFAAIRPLTQELCLEGYFEAMHGNWPSAKRKFDYANRFATNCIERPELIAVISGVAIRKFIYQTGYRIIETNPKLASRIQEYLRSPALNTVCNPQKILESEFVAQLTIGRNFDVPYFDRSEIPAPLDKIIKLDDREKLSQLTQVKGGDYLPDSRHLRKFLLARLLAWKPLFSESTRTGKIDSNATKTANDFFHDLPSKLSFFAQIQSFDAELVTHGMERSMQQADMNLAILKAIEYRAKTGEYPKTLAATGVTLRKLIPSESAIYTVSKIGITIKAWDDSKSTDDKASVLSFPPSLTQVAKSP